MRNLIATSVLGLCVSLAIPYAMAQGGPGGPPGRGPNGEGFGSPGQMQQRMIDNVQTVIEATDDEWAAIKPLVKSVVDARSTVSALSGGRGMGMGPGGPGAPGGPGGPGRMDRQGQAGPPRVRAGSRMNRPAGGPARAAEVENLQNVLDNANATSDEVAEKLAALRKARKEAAAKLDTAQSTLREVLTVRQEAALVLTGLLD